MDTVHKLETLVAGWFEKAPHLPKGGREWLATNAWWLVLVGAIFGAFGVVSLLWVTLIGAAMVTGLAGVAGVALGGLAMIVAFVTMIVTGLWVLLAGLAVKPLKASQKRGWDLLFLALLLEAAAVAVAFLLSFDVGSLLSGVIGLALGAYVLFEIRAYFTVHKVSKAHAAA